jgi:single-strand DNA-binding protein
MAGSVNRAFVTGNLGKDPEVRSTQDGRKIVNLTLATSESWTDRQSGERKEKTEWHRITVIGNDRAADYAEKYLRKGSLVHVEGKLQTRKWTDQQGQDRYTTEIVVGPFNSELTGLDRGGDRQDGASNGNGQHQQRGNQRPTADYRAGPSRNERQQAPAQSNMGDLDGGDLDDSIPF